MKQGVRLAGLDALRGVAALAVVLYHVTTWYAEEMGGHPDPGPVLTLPFGHFGVELFFIISGFVIFMTLQRCHALADFATARLIRLYPGFLACLCLALLVSLTTVTPYQVLANITMMPEILGARAIDGSYWSLAYELVFYALAGFCVLVMRWRTPEPACAVWIAVALAIRLSGLDLEFRLLERLTAAWFAHLFIIGIMLFRIHAGQATKLTWVLLLVGLEVAFLGPHWAFQPISPLVNGAMIAGFTALVWFSASPRGEALAIPPLRFLGRISYPLYLVHQAAGFQLIASLEAAGVEANLAIATTIAAAILAAWGITDLIEAPARHALRHRLRRTRVFA